MSYVGAREYCAYASYNQILLVTEIDHFVVLSYGGEICRERRAGATNLSSSYMLGCNQTAIWDNYSTEKYNIEAVGP